MRFALTFGLTDDAPKVTLTRAARSRVWWYRHIWNPTLGHVHRYSAPAYEICRKCGIDQTTAATQNKCPACRVLVDGSRANLAAHLLKRHRIRIADDWVDEWL